MTELTLTANTEKHSLGDDNLAHKCREMLEALRKVGIGLIPKRVSETKISLYYDQREQSCKLCQDNRNSDPYLIEAWVIFESLDDTDSDKFYQALQDIGIFDDFNYRFDDEEEDY